MSRYLKRHHEDVATIIRMFAGSGEHPDPKKHNPAHCDTCATVSEIGYQFERLFHADENPCFSREQFRKACGLDA